MILLSSPISQNSTKSTLTILHTHRFVTKKNVPKWPTCSVFIPDFENDIKEDDHTFIREPPVRHSLPLGRVQLKNVVTLWKIGTGKVVKLHYDLFKSI